MAECACTYNVLYWHYMVNMNTQRVKYLPASIVSRVPDEIRRRCRRRRHGLAEPYYRLGPFDM